MSGTFKVSVVTPERQVLATEARFVAFPAFDGEMGILPHRAALLTRLGSGTLRIEEATGATRTFFVSGGLAQMIDDKLTLLTDEARDPDSLTEIFAKEALSATIALPRQTDAQVEKRARSADRARAIEQMMRFRRGH